MSYRNHTLTLTLTLALVGSIVGCFHAAHADDPPGKAKEPTSSSPFFFVNDNRLTLAYQPTGVQPGFPGTTARQVAAFTHFDVWALWYELRERHPVQIRQDQHVVEEQV